MNASLFVSVVVPLSDDADILPGFLEELAAALRTRWENYEIVLVDDGSRDATPAVIDGLLKQHACVRYLRLSRSFGVENAVLAGLDGTLGDVVVVLQPDCDPPGLVPDFVEAARKAGGIVIGTRTGPARERALYRLGRRGFAWLVRRWMGLDLHPDAALFLACTRQAMNAVLRIKDKSRALRLIGTWVGFRQEYLPYRPVERRVPPRRRSLMEGIERGVSLIITNTSRPLRIFTILGLIGGALNVLYMVYIAAIALLKPRVAEGWVTLSMQHAVMFLLVFAILSVLCEYVGRILEETRDRPAYLVAEERHSSVMIANEERRNVVAEAQ